MTTENYIAGQGYVSCRYCLAREMDDADDHDEVCPRYKAHAAGFREGVLCGREQGAEVADRWEAAYPVEIWPDDGNSIDAKAAKHGRHVAKCIAEDIRARPGSGEGGDMSRCIVAETVLDMLASLRSQIGFGNDLKSHRT